MNIHHATRTAIEKAGFLVNSDDDTDFVTVVCQKPGFTFSAYDPETIVDDAKALRMVISEYPNVEWSKVAEGWALSVGDTDIEATADEGELQTAIDEILEAAGDSLCRADRPL